MRSRYPVLMGLAIATAGCASVMSVPSPELAEGLSYYLPKKDFLVTLTVTSNGRTLNVDTTPAYPDDQYRYVIRFSRNVVGKNDLDIAVTPSGLLTSAKSTTTSNFGDVLKDLAGTIGTFGLDRRTAPAAQGPCTELGTYSMVIAPETAGPTVFCAFTVTVEQLASPKFDAVTGAADKEKAGIYYRTALPYAVTVMESNTKGVTLKEATVQAETAGSRTFVLFSPSESQPQFLPIARTVFANNEATLTFEDGMPKGYKQSADGELVALAKLPASIVAAYFDAIGNAFGKRKGALTNETQYLQAVQSAELERLKFEQCKAALATNDPAAIKAACGG